MDKNYLFKSKRLGFRNWEDKDIQKMIGISADIDVMEFFPAPATPQQTSQFIERMQAMFVEKGFCYFAVDQLIDSEFIGFIGLCEQNFEAPFTPCIDIGWRLGKPFWGNGYATEGAERCLQYAFKDLNFKNIKSTAPEINTKSIKIMEKIGMKKQLNFKHPRLKGNDRIESCVCYQINN